MTEWDVYKRKELNTFKLAQDAPQKDKYNQFS